MGYRDGLSAAWTVDSASPTSRAAISRPRGTGTQNRASKPDFLVTRPQFHDLVAAESRRAIAIVLKLILASRARFEHRWSYRHALVFSFAANRANKGDLDLQVLQWRRRFSDILDPPFGFGDVLVGFGA